MSASDLETTLELVAIAAVARNGIIGADGEMPWHIPADLRHFMRETTGHPVVIGRITYESIVAGLGEPLPERTSIVLTGQDPAALPQADASRVVVVSGLEDALRAAERAADERHDGTGRAFVAGGATVYEQFLPATDRLLLTEVDATPEGDTTFPAWERDEWREVSRDDRDGFAFLEYVRR
ncbi:dihydrofolate reductase [Natronobiforma cellulositropha]|uniref:dihydrofolate reductase n=1 Tax=Natronobiforma cellulositropha TaxID=1679076 RepID=UPI0021D5C12C|nr:dihydrofolate reductase [Natronobiforma cellulositropha]